uniref:Uncharacterized protein n=1 Tax=Glossina palpalis gambiensis TaxID=67801 RepID=A0A1B0BTJ4_9MUSC
MYSASIVLNLIFSIFACKDGRGHKIYINIRLPMRRQGVKIIIVGQDIICEASTVDVEPSSAWLFYSYIMLFFSTQFSSMQAYQDDRNKQLKQILGSSEGECDVVNHMNLRLTSMCSKASNITALLRRLHEFATAMQQYQAKMQPAMVTAQQLNSAATAHNSNRLLYFIIQYKLALVVRQPVAVVEKIQVKPSPFVDGYKNYFRCRNQKYGEHVPATNGFITFHNDARSTLLCNCKCVSTVCCVLNHSPEHFMDAIILVNEYSDHPENGLELAKIIRCLSQVVSDVKRAPEGPLRIIVVIRFQYIHASSDSLSAEERAIRQYSAQRHVGQTYFTKLSKRDRMMNAWGDENLEISFHIRHNGGGFEIIPCSRVEQTYTLRYAHSNCVWLRDMRCVVGRLQKMLLHSSAFSEKFTTSQYMVVQIQSDNFRLGPTVYSLDGTMGKVHQGGFIRRRDSKDE